MMKPEQNDFKKVQLTDEIYILTPLDESYIPALRCGFAGYPVNPRWNAVKFHAWKTGRQWRQAHAQGTMVVRSTDSLLVPLEEAEVLSEATQNPPHLSARKWHQLVPFSLLSKNRNQPKELTLA